MFYFTEYFIISPFRYPNTYCDKLQQKTARNERELALTDNLQRKGRVYVFQACQQRVGLNTKFEAGYCRERGLTSSAVAVNLIPKLLCCKLIFKFSFPT